MVVTDPIWPNGARAFPGVDAWRLWEQVAPLLAAISVRMVVILGCDSDPRFLSAIPAELPFVRTCRLRFNAPSYRGTIMIDADQAYVFGEAFANGNGTHRVLPGEARAREKKALSRVWEWERPGGGKPAERRAGRTDQHPSPRHPDHMLWLIENFTRPNDLVVDPFAGTGTTLWAAREMGRRAWGCEIDERWCQATKRRLAQRILFAPGEEATCTTK